MHTLSNDFVILVNSIREFIIDIAKQVSPQAELHIDIAHDPNEKSCTISCFYHYEINSQSIRRKYASAYIDENEMVFRSTILKYSDPDMLLKLEVITTQWIKSFT